MVKRLFDFILSFFGLLFFLPLILLVCFLIWITDFHSPFYRGRRMGMNGKIFLILKMRSMRVNADRSGVTSTSSNDSRIIWIGHFVRKFKLDEITQLWNVFVGEMSLVGPRPQVENALSRYSEEDKKVLKLRPGITDFASIVFSDEGEILKNEKDADEAYYRIIHPWKMQMSLFYKEKRSLALDIYLIFCTLICIVSKRRACELVSEKLKNLGASADLVEVSLRRNTVIPVLHNQYKVQNPSAPIANF